MKNALLIGIGGTYNYGCEAIVRGTVAILKAFDPGINVYYASYNYADDARRLADCDVKIISRPRRKKWTLRNILRKALSYVGIAHMLPYDSLKWVRSFDTVFSIGGDIYTLSSAGTYDKSLPLFLEQCQSLGLKYVLWGASVGKFEKSDKALSFFRGHLPKIDCIVARERNTVDYLKTLGCEKNVFLAPDPAYFVSCPVAESKESNKRQAVGINLSPLSALYEYGNIAMAIRNQSRAIARLIEKMNCSILLIPHVIAPNANDNDLSYLRLIRKNISPRYRNAVTLVDSDPGFVGIKHYLSQCDCVVAARMHCAINAITMGVPTLFLSYSEKAKGMSRYVYGTADSVVSVKEFEDTELIMSKLCSLPEVVHIDNIRNFDFHPILSVL